MHARKTMHTEKQTCTTQSCNCLLEVRIRFSLMFSFDVTGKKNPKLIVTEGNV